MRLLQTNNSLSNKLNSKEQKVSEGNIIKPHVLLHKTELQHTALCLTTTLVISASLACIIHFFSDQTDRDSSLHCFMTFINSSQFSGRKQQAVDRG